MRELRTLQSLLHTLPGRGEAPALVALDKEDAGRWSYAELADQAGRLARGLAGRGVGRGDYVAISSGNSPGWITACLAVIGAGAVVVTLDTQIGDGMLRGALEDSGARLVFTTAEGAARIEGLKLGHAPELVLLDMGEDDARGWRQLLSGGDGEELPLVEPEDQAALFYTSGTTGTAKGVPLNHRNLAFQLNTLLVSGVVADDDRVMLPLPLHHVYPFMMGMLTPLAAGLPVVMPYALTGPQIVRALREGEVSLIVGVPRLYDALYSGIEERAKSGSRLVASLFTGGVSVSLWLRRRLGLRVGGYLLRPIRERFGPNLRVLASGGAALDPDLAGKLEAVGWRVAVGYGLTETSPLLTLNPPDGEKLASVGRPVPGVEVRVDPSAMPDEGEQPERRVGGAREEGEILARGPNVFSGYRNLPDETGKVLTGDGWFRTGDLGYFDESGYLYVTGRASTLIVTEGGKNVQPENVEEVYVGHSVVREIGVLQKGGRLVAVIVPEVGEIRDRDAEIHEAIRKAVEEYSQNLPSYQRLSDYAVSREPLEYTQLGKLRRHLLSGHYDRAKEGEEGETPGPMPVEEMGEEDRELLEDEAAEKVWEMLAGRYPDRRLTPETSPQLDLGVDSMEWVNLTMDIGENAGVELDEEAIGRIETVHDLLREVSRGAVAQGSGGAASGVSPVAHPDTVLDERQRRWLRPLGPAALVASRAMFLLDRVLARGLFKLRVEGVENLPEEGPFVIAPNHVSYLDSFVVAAALDHRRLRETYWAGWTGAAFGNPVTRLVSRLARVVPVNPDRAGSSSLAFGSAVLGSGKNLVWFPEGQRSGSGELQTFKRGIGMLLAHHEVPVVPVFIQGTHEAMPPGKVIVCPGKVTVVFGEPLGVQELEERGEGDRTQDRIVDGLRDRIKELGGLS